MNVSSDIYRSIAQDFAQLKEAKRAKKLVFYASQRYWETDFSIVNSYSWENLLQNLYENNPTIDDLKALLYHAVNTLNRKEIYGKIAKYIFKKMSVLYQNIPADSSPANKTEGFEDELMTRILVNIDNHEESIRMKKLMFAICKQYWENDINVINTYDLREIILEIRELYPTFKRLRQALDNIVSTINRQNFYSFIADTIVGELIYLYTCEPVSSTSDVKEGGQKVEEETQLIKAKSNSRTDREQHRHQVDAEAKETMIAEVQTETAAEPSMDLVGANAPEGQVIPWLKVDNLFDLKQEIVQYTNPLRAKILLFYAIYGIDTSEQHWSVVRTCTLDDLLIRMFQHYDKKIDEIESQLMEIANSRIEGLEPEDNLQTVTAILEAIRHFYQKG